MPFLRVGKVSNAFRQLKKAVLQGAGFDYLAVCADVMRSKNFKSSKIGVANRSRHKCGDAFDADQSVRALVIVSEPHGIQQFFRMWLRCAKQDGTLGIQTTLKDIRGATVKGWYFDFTAAAERLGWQRIPAWKGWGLKGSNYNKMEFWHYQITEGLSFDEAMDYLYNPLSKVITDSRKPNPERIIGLNDRGSAVRNLQEKLSKLKDKNKQPYLPRNEIDGVYGKITQTAVKRLQEDYGLDSDGLVGPNTRALIERIS
jgi:murein L,D-transpeptidase YcbB/YkuD